jgi:hypothetical protein
MYWYIIYHEVGTGGATSKQTHDDCNIGAPTTLKQSRSRTDNTAMTVKDKRIHILVHHQRDQQSQNEYHQRNQLFSR